jgi:dimeric dUTPase (all-alpha-NTP-PPase superfamily)
MYENMVKSIDASILPGADILVQHLRQKLPKVYTEKGLIPYCDALDLVFKIGVKLEYTPMMLYLPARPRLADSLVVQFQNINKIIATRNQNKEWFHDLFALIVALPTNLSLSWKEIEGTVIARNI